MEIHFSNKVYIFRSLSGNVLIKLPGIKCVDTYITTIVTIYYLVLTGLSAYIFCIFPLHGLYMYTECPVCSQQVPAFMFTDFAVCLKCCLSLLMQDCWIPCCINSCLFEEQLLHISFLRWAKPGLSSLPGVFL